MRRFLIVIMGVFAIVTMQAQGIFDVLKYSNPTINGTARYMSMGGSFGALGGEVSSVMDNPAALGLFRKSELSFTLDFMPSITYSDWNGVEAFDNRFNVNINNFSLINTISTHKDVGYISSNFNYSYRRVKTFNRRIAVDGASSGQSLTDFIAELTNGLNANDIASNGAYENINIPWLSILGYDGDLIYANNTDLTRWYSVLNSGESVIPLYSALEFGRIDEYNFSYGGNVSDVVYFGAGLSLNYIDYNLVSNYEEQFAQGGGFKLTNEMSTVGTGWTFKVGAIVRPASFLRLGFSLHTPTYYYLNDSYYTKLRSSQVNKILETPGGYSDYRFRTPLKLQGSIGFVFGKIAVLNIDYLYSDTRQMLLGTGQYKSNPYNLDNEDIANYTLASHMVKVGAEIRVLPSMMLRGGYAYSTAPVSESAIKSVPLNTIRTDMNYSLDQRNIYYTGGIGWRKKSISFDLAYVFHQQNQLFMPFETGNKADAAHIRTNYHNIVATLGFKF